MPAITVNSTDTFEQWRVKTNQIAANVDNLLTGSGNIIANNSTNALYIEQSGTGNALLVADIQNDTTPFIVNSQGLVGISCANPTVSLEVGGATGIEAAKIKANTSTGMATIVDNLGGGLEIGFTYNRSSETTPFIDFHSSNTAVNYNARIIATGNTAVTGSGNLQFIAANLTMTGANLFTTRLISTAANVTDATIGIVRGSLTGTNITTTSANVTDATITTIRSTTGVIETVQATATTQSTSTTTGALQVSGGAGIAANLYVGGNVRASNSIISTTANVTDATITTVRSTSIFNTANINAGNVNSNIWGRTANFTGSISAGSIIVDDGAIVANVTSTGTSNFDTVVINTTNTTDALRVTQIGTGNALYVGDNTYPDTRPFLIDKEGNVGIGLTNPIAKVDIIDTLGSTRDHTRPILNLYSSTSTSNTLVIRNSASTSNILALRVDGGGRFIWGANLLVGPGPFTMKTHDMTYRAGRFVNLAENSFESSHIINAVYTISTGAPTFSFAKSANNSAGGHGVVTTSHSLGAIHFQGSDGDTFQVASRIVGTVDAAVPAAANTVPGGLSFETASVGSNVLTRRAYLNSDGNLYLYGTGGDQLVVYRDTSQFLTINNSNYSPTPTFTSYSATNNAKTIVFDSTTDRSDTQFTVGQLGYAFNIRGTSAIQITQDTAQQNVFNVLSTVGNSIFYATTQSTSTTTGALQVRGGVGISANLYVGENVDIAATVDAAKLISTTANVTDATITTVRSTTGLVTGTTQSTSTTTGALQVSGGAGVAANLYVGGNVRATNSVISTTANVTDATITTVRSTTGVIGTVQATATTQSTSTSTGALQVSGGAGIAANLYVGGNARITSTTQSTSIYNGALQVSGGAGVTGNVNIGGNLSVTGCVSIAPINYSSYALSIVPTTSASFASQDGIYVYQPLFGGTGPAYNSFLAFNINESGGLYANPLNGFSTTTESLSFSTNGGSIQLGVTSNYINFTSGGNANFITDYVHFTLVNDLTVTADNAIINGNLAVRSGLIFRRQAAATGQNSTITLTAGNLLNQIYNVTPSVAINLTLPTGNNLQAESDMQSSDSFDWTIINDGTNRATLLASTNHTISGNANVLNGTSGLFRSRRTGSANVYITYRLA